MEYEIVIRGGTVVDGTGAEPSVTDIAIDAGRIAAIGPSIPVGREEIDAASAIVTPGFVDLHTHFDAQVGWDPLLRPSSQHGVTTALMGNCGMGFAPVRRDGRDALAQMMEAVEDIPATAILDGLPWDWESYGEYLDTVERLGVAVNLAGLVGHSPLRSYVMGHDAVEGHPTAAQRDEQAAILSDALGAGAAGFSTSRYRGHRLPDGRCVPGTDAHLDELRALARVVGSRGLFQVVVNDQAFRAEMDVLRALASDGARVLFLVGVGDDERSGESVQAMFERFEADGLDITGMIAPRPGGLLVGVSGSLLPWRTPRWAALHRLTPAERLAAMADAGERAALVAEADAAEPFLAADQIFPLGAGESSYVAGASGSLASVAAASNETPAAYFVRVALETDGGAFFTARLFNRNVGAIEYALRSPHVLPGLGDAGAHVGQVMDAGWTTFWLAHWIRDRGLFTLAEGVRRITSVPAALLGLDRGRLEVGAPADVNVIDLDRLASGPVARVDDLPGGAGRLTQSASGYRATIVNGKRTVRDDEHTGTAAGVVLRRFSA